MKIHGVSYHSIMPLPDGGIRIIDQRHLPHRLVFVEIHDEKTVIQAITEMWTRGAPLLAEVGAYGLALALGEQADDAALDAAYARLLATRPTAVNLRWALDRVKSAVLALPVSQRACVAREEAKAICDEELHINQAIGDQGLGILEAAFRRVARPVNILTHCNAGWLATMDWGTALAPVYKAHDLGIPVHVWVDETRPRNQGAALTVWELAGHGVPHTLITDNAGGLLMQGGQVDVCLVGADRVAANGDVCNKIGTYLKALAAYDNGVPFYVALPYTTIDWTLADGRRIPIEQRAEDEVTHMSGLDDAGVTRTVLITRQGTVVANYGFDVTPARLVTGLITERGICAPAALAGLYGKD